MITTAGAIAEFTIPGNTLTYGIASGSDGNIWFTQPDGQIGRANLPSTPSGPGLQFVPMTPCRVADTRNPDGPFGARRSALPLAATSPSQPAPAGFRRMRPPTR